MVVRRSSYAHAPYVPDRGDLIWLDFDPQSGHEQKGRRPALVITPFSYNSRTGLAVMCPVTSKIKGYPFEVEFSGEKISGAVLSDQVKCLDWRARHAEFIARVDAAVIDEISENLRALLVL